MLYLLCNPQTRIDKLFPLSHYHHHPSSLPTPSPNPDSSFSPSPVVQRRAVFASLRTVVCFGAFVERVNYFLVLPFVPAVVAKAKLSSARLSLGQRCSHRSSHQQHQH
ncbi:hypothetical protein FJTKL_11549 [Diaporthe vaccinii]|uniref:Uncharacterized protein n=1 Tax=Diaporthe vaccinii TaxID=105482 RepID=A0ABR4EG22_9PEZI